MSTSLGIAVCPYWHRVHIFRFRIWYNQLHLEPPFIWCTYCAAGRRAEVIALSSQSRMATGPSHITLLLIHLDWAAQPSLSAWVHVFGTDVLVQKGLISEVAVASRLHVNRAGWQSISQNESWGVNLASAASAGLGVNASSKKRLVCQELSLCLYIIL